MTNTKSLNKVLSWTTIICSATLFLMLIATTWMGGNPYITLMFHGWSSETDTTLDVCWNYTAIVLIFEIIALAAIVWKMVFCSIPNLKKVGAEPNIIGGLVIDALFACAVLLLIIWIPLMAGTKAAEWSGFQAIETRAEVLDMISYFAIPLGLITSIAGLKIGKTAYKK